MSERRKVLELFEQQKAYTEKKVQDGIEAYRKTGAVITLKDKKGNPVKNAAITVKQKSHAFQYGANLFMLDELETKEKNDLYKKHMRSFGNMATLPFYWDATEPEQGKTRYGKDSEKLYRRPPIDLCIEFCQANGIEPREHALAYENFFPKWLYGASVEEIKTALEKRYREISQRYADKIPTIEVTNEMEWAKGKTAFYDEADYVLWCFQLAEKYFPNNQLVRSLPGNRQVLRLHRSKYAQGRTDRRHRYAVPCIPPAGRRIREHKNLLQSGNAVQAYGFVFQCRQTSADHRGDHSRLFLGSGGRSHPGRDP